MQNQGALLRCNERIYLCICGAGQLCVEHLLELLTGDSP